MKIATPALYAVTHLMFLLGIAILLAARVHLPQRWADVGHLLEFLGIVAVVTATIFFTVYAFRIVR